MRYMRTCGNCDRPIMEGCDVWYIEGEEEQFCCEKCLRKHVEDCLIEDAINEYMENHAIEGVQESSNPWDNFGVSKSDFI